MRALLRRLPWWKCAGGSSQEITFDPEGLFPGDSDVENTGDLRNKGDRERSCSSHGFVTFLKYWTRTVGAWTTCEVRYSIHSGDQRLQNGWMTAAAMCWPFDVEKHSNSELRVGSAEAGFVAHHGASKC